MPLVDCELYTLTDLSNLVCTDSSVRINPDYVDDPLCPRAAFSIELYIGDVPYEFNQFYWSKTMTIVENRGFERGKATFTLVDWDPDKFNMPLTPAVEQRVRISNLTKDDIYFDGRISDMKIEPIVRRCDGTEVNKYKITCSDMRTDLERILIAETYENVTTGFIIRDVIRRFTPLDHTQIDPTLGATVKEFRVNQRYPAQVIQRILDLQTTWTFWIDHETNTPYVGEKLDTINHTGIYVTEDNLYDLFDKNDFYLAPDVRGLRNKVKFFFNKRYTAGLANATTGEKAVLGYQTDWTDKMSGAKFRFIGSSAEYTVSDVLGISDLRLSSEFEEPIITFGEYELTGIKSHVVVSDHNSILCQADILNESKPSFNYPGEFQTIVSGDNNPYTFEEAREIAQTHLLNYSNPVLKGNAGTNNVKLPNKGLRAGQSFDVDLPISKNIKATIVIQRLTRKDLGGILERCADDPTNTSIDPLLSLKLDLEDRMFDERNQIKRLMADVRRVEVVDTEEVEVAIILPEQIIVQDCANLVDPITILDYIEVGCALDLRGPDITLTEGIEVGCAFLTKTTFPTGPFYSTETTNTAGYCIGRNQYAHAT